MTDKYPNLQPLAVGDEYIPSPAAQWDTSVMVPRNPHAVWNLLSRMGLQRPEEEGAGYFLPKRIERFLPEAVRSIDTLTKSEADLPRQREVGDRLRDVAKGSFAEVVYINHDVRSLVLDSYWPGTDKRDAMHYSWTLHVGHSQTPDSSWVMTRIRKDMPFKRFGRIIPIIDRWAMQQLSQGLTERIPK